MGQLLFDLHQNFHTRHMGHFHVRHHNVHFALLQEGQGSDGIVDGCHCIARVLKQGLQHKKIVLFIVYDENMGIFGHDENLCMDI